MKIAVVGSRNLTVGEDALDKYLADADEIVSGGARGVDTSAAEFAKRRGVKLVEILPKYNIYGRGATIVRNKEIVDCADKVIVFWDGSSKGTLSVIKYAQSINKPCDVIVIQ